MGFVLVLVCGRNEVVEIKVFFLFFYDVELGRM